MGVEPEACAHVALHRYRGQYSCSASLALLKGLLGLQGQTDGTSCEAEALPTQIQAGRCGNTTSRALHSSRNIQVKQTGFLSSWVSGLCSLPLGGQTSASDLPPSRDHQDIPQVTRFPEKPGTESFPRPLWQHKPRKISL